MDLQLIPQTEAMKTFIIERNLPGIGGSSEDDLKVARDTSCSVLDRMNPDIKWIRSFVTKDKIYCVYQAKNKELIQKHADSAGFPANSIEEVSAIFHED